MHTCCYDPWTDRIWAGNGDGTNVNAIHSLDSAGQFLDQIPFCDCAYGASAYGELVLVWGAGLGFLDPVTMEPVAFVDDAGGSAQPAIAGNMLYATFEPTVVAYQLD